MPSPPASPDHPHHLKTPIDPKRRFVEHLADVTVKVMIRLIAVRFAREAAAHPSDPTIMNLDINTTPASHLLHDLASRRPSTASQDSHLETPPFSPTDMTSHPSPSSNDTVVHDPIASNLPDPIQTSYMRWHSQLTRLRESARIFAGNQYLSRAPHGILYALYLARRILLCPNERYGTPTPTTDTTPLHPVPRELLLNPSNLFLACLLLAETHLSDRQTSTRVWARAAGIEKTEDGVSPGVFVARLKGLALDTLGFNSLIAVEEYASWLRALRSLMGGEEEAGQGSFRPQNCHQCHQASVAPQYHGQHLGPPAAYPTRKSSASPMAMQAHLAFVQQGAYGNGWVGGYPPVAAEQVAYGGGGWYRS
ncbi:hypothetical protein HDU67_006954 [Dinochytrium kinnereticum]|nr:hypothetical protein HDU67_006954 [Dinochytrium kinnereticum]